jgi:hypothetical protein
MAKMQLLVKVGGDGRAFTAAAHKAFGAAAIEVEPILAIPDGADGPGVAPSQAATWLRLGTSGADDDNPWDAAHSLAATGHGFGAAARTDIQMIEPDIEQAWLPPPESPMGLAVADRCSFLDQDPKGGKAKGPGLAWNLGASFSEFAKAHTTMAQALPRN